MIILHRLGHQDDELQLNPDLIITIEANPDTVITLTTGAKVVVAEPPEWVAADVRRYRAEILAGALQLRDEQGGEFSGPSGPTRRLVAVVPSQDESPAS